MHSHPAEIHVKDGLGISRHPFGYGMNSHYLLGVGHTQLLRISPTFRLDGYHRLHCVCVISRFGRVQLFVTLGTAACQAPLPMGFSKQE